MHCCYDDHLFLAPEVAESISASPINTTRVRVNWMEPRVGGFDGFVIRINDMDFFENETARFAVLGGLTPGTSYQVQVFVLFNDVESSGVSENVATGKLLSAHIVDEKCVEVVCVHLS